MKNSDPFEYPDGAPSLMRRLCTRGISVTVGVLASAVRFVLTAASVLAAWTFLVLMFWNPTSSSSTACSQISGLDRYALYERGFSPNFQDSAHRYCVGVIGSDKSMLQFAQGEQVQSDCFSTMPQAEQRFNVLTRVQVANRQTCAAPTMAPDWNQYMTRLRLMYQHVFVYLRATL